MRSLAPSMRKPGSFVAALCVAALAVACQEQPTTDPLEGFVCTASVEPAIVVRLVDGETGTEGLPGFALMAPQFGTVRDGGYVDSLRLSSFSEDTLHSVWAAPERPGRYDVLVRIGGYGDWLALGVTVEGGVCHVQTVELRAVLLPT